MNRARRSKLVVTLLLLTMVLAVGCVSLPKRNPVPEHLTAVAKIPGFGAVRFVGPEGASEGISERTKIYQRQILASGIGARPQRYLALSGGGANGAFGAGLLMGWSKTGERPEFHYVTGISTGALSAPFAFLGSEYDSQLKEVYTTISTKDVLTKRGVLAALGGDAFADTGPLKRLLARYIDDTMIQAIAREHKRGRRLWIGTTDMDRMKQVFWDIGKVAASGHPKAGDLIRQVLLASASIPGAFPPVMFEIEAEGKRYDEMHVDGGVSSQVFVYPLTVKVGQALDKANVNQDRKLYVIRNSQLDMKWAATERKLLSMAGRSISGLLQSQSFGDMYKIYLGTKRDRIDFNLAYIPKTFTSKSREAFDTKYMNELFDVGYKMALKGYPWRKQAPNLATP
jgi:predicted acylesterase/phospholipase RssA